MKKLAIISTYNESCGNASYTEVLRKEFSKYYEVDILPLQLDILSSNASNIKKIANKHIDEISQAVKNYDYVNIQFEAGLYGNTKNDILRRVKKIIKASNNVILTMHRVDLPKSIFSLKTFKVLVSSKNIIGNLRRIRNEIYFKSLYKDLIKIMKDHSKNNGSNIIVHTKRDKKTIERFFDFKNVHDFPLTFLNKEERLREKNISERNGFIERYSLNKNDKIIGIFGYISEYKGHETIIKALSYLPDDYKLLIFGSQHPMSIQEYKSCDDYIEKLLQLIENISKNRKSFNERIQFLGNLDDDRFIEALYCCDFAVLPYLEVNQGGSGIASLVLETKINALYSNNKAFDELNKYFPNTFSRFDIGNYMELAKKIKDYKENYTLKIDDCLETYNIENNIIFHKNIFEGGMKK
jgi:glycosyltransferase involved in cell wall biosynthesis